LVTGASVFAASLKAQLRETIGTVFVGQYVINSTNGGSLSFDQQFVDQINALPEVGDATGLGFARMQDEEGAPLWGTTGEGPPAGPLLDYDFVAGSFAALTPDGMLISTGEAKRPD